MPFSRGPFRCRCQYARPSIWSSWRYLTENNAPSLVGCIPREDVEEEFEVVSIRVRQSIKNVDGHELQGASPESSSATLTTSLFAEIKINQHTCPLLPQP